MLGLIHDTNKLTVAIPGPYLCELHNLIDTTWHTNLQSFTFREAQQLVDKLGYLAKGAPWVFHLMTHLYVTSTYALA